MWIDTPHIDKADREKDRQEVDDDFNDGHRWRWSEGGVEVVAEQTQVR